MKSWLRNIIYGMLRPFISMRSFTSLSLFKNFSNRYREENICKPVSPDNKVLSGPFKGLKYAVLEAAGSVLIPKITGTYEDELHEVIEMLCKKNYSTIIDIGAAEGYYSNGFAMRIPNAEVFAYDTDKHAQFLCRKNAAVNGFDKRIKIRSLMNAKELASFPLLGKCFIICDCEGYEIELFTKESVKNLNNCDLIIELHDCDNPSISKTILPLFEGTHRLRLINSNPAKKTIAYPFLKNLPVTDEMLDERSGTVMQWAYLESIYSSN